MPETNIYPVFGAIAESTHITKSNYEELYQDSLNDPDTFWAQQAEEFLDWYETWKKVSNYNFNTAEIKWFEGGKLNVAYDCIDMHLKTRATQIAMIWEGDNPDESAHITYQQLHDEVCRLANALKANGAKKGAIHAYGA